MPTAIQFLSALRRPASNHGRARAVARTLAGGAVALLSVVAHAQTTLLADQALFTANPVPGNLALALSVEFPTAISVAHVNNTYSSAATYQGYFDPAKCYVYRISATDTTVAPSATAPDSYFYPDGAASARTCSGKWSGNFLNWATMQTVDPFRWALTGGHRVIDTPNLTVLEKAWASAQGSTANFPNRSLTSSSVISGATPLTGLSAVHLSVWGLGNRLRFSSASANLGNTGIHYNNTTGTANVVYEVFARVKVCDSAATAGGLESNCVAYGSNYKPEGLIQRYSDRIRYSAFGYLNDTNSTSANLLRDGGVLRARQKYVGPSTPIPGAPPQANSGREWNPTTGVFEINPSAADATSTATLFGVAVTNSGVINYLNQFGRASRAYKTYDPVGELYYAAIRYFKNLGNVPAWTNVPTGTGIGARTEWVDNFPVITQWDDPIIYSCQRNFILGIGDANTHADANVPGTGTPTANEPTKPTFNDTVDAVQATNRIGVLEGLGSSLGTTNPYNGCCSNNTALMAGLAYDSHTRDIRPDVNGQANTLGMQTISTYWLDVMEYQTMKPKNQFWLAAKYGGFEVPSSGFDLYSNTTALPTGWWHTNTDTLPDGSPRPNNYFTAGAPDQMIAGLNSAFADMAARIRAYTTSFSTTLPQVSQTGNGSYSTQYDSQTWTGEVTASVLNFNTASGDPELVTPPAWIFSDEIAAQLAGAGWNTGRRMATWNPTTRLGVAFRSSAASGGSTVTAAQLAALDTPYTTGNDSVNYLNYLRGDRTHEIGSTASGSTNAYRVRPKLIGDIEGSKAVPIGPPNYPFKDAKGNLGYEAFKSTWATRRTVVYVGSNDGALHAINGALQKTNASGNALETDPNAGREMFAYVPNALFQGPNNTPGTDGLAALGRNPFIHKYFVNASPVTFDVDFWRTWNVGTNSWQSSTGSPDWRTILVGGLGKGGKTYYALDITDPVTMSLNETNLASKVLWEFTDPTMGYTYGDPLIIKTKRFGWVVVLVSGYNNSDGYGYIYFVNPRTGDLLDRVRTPSPSTALTQINGYVNDYEENYTDALYAVDLDGVIWRLDITNETGAYPGLQVFARLTDDLSNPQPITAKPIVEWHPRDERRYVMAGTGKLLHTTDIASTQEQTYYGITDGTGEFGGFLPLPPSPITKSNLQQVIDPLVGVEVNHLTRRGWYHNLGAAAGGQAYRVVFRPSSFYGSATFVATALDASNVCSPSGSSKIYSVDFSTGRSLLRLLSSGSSSSSGGSTTTSTAVPFIETGTNVTDIKDLSVNGRREIIYGDDRGGLSQARTEAAPGLPSRRMNWREIPTLN